MIAGRGGGWDRRGAYAYFFSFEGGYTIWSPKLFPPGREVLFFASGGILFSGGSVLYSDGGFTCLQTLCSTCLGSRCSHCFLTPASDPNFLSKPILKYYVKFPALFGSECLRSEVFIPSPFLINEDGLRSPSLTRGRSCPVFSPL